jgi:hypothetical protein
VCSVKEILDDAPAAEAIAATVSDLHGRITTRAADRASWLRSASTAVTVLVTYVSLPVIAAAATIPGLLFIVG